MKPVEIDNDKIIKSISDLRLDEYDKDDEENKTSYYINALRKEQEKFKNDKDRYELYEREISNQKDDLEYKNKVHHEEKPTVDKKALDKLQKLHYLIDAMTDLCSIFKIDSTYEPVERRFEDVFENVIQPAIHWNDEFVIKYERKNHKEFLKQRENKGDNVKSWEDLIDKHLMSLKQDHFVICLIPPTAYDKPIYIKDNDMIYSSYKFPLFHGKDGQEDDRFKNCMLSIVSKCFNELYYINTLDYSWKIDDKYKYCILYLVFKNDPK